ncbi:MAG TPA: GNAT family N-acetyltransferase [Gemmatimonadaceae bacterium]|jgi:Predicted acetyltransferase
MTAPIQVTNNTSAGQFEILEDGKLATLAYSERDGKLYLIHTEVPRELGGRGYASALARTALDFARQNQLTVVPYCPFVRAYLKRHPEYASLVK